jgi:hypothetical protein
MVMKLKGVTFAAVALVGASTLVGLAAASLTGPSKLSTLTSAGVVSYGSPATIGNSALAAAPANQISGGDSALWIDSFQNAGPTVGSATMTQTWDPSRHTLVPGSLNVPGGWIPSYTTDGTNWVSTEPADPTTIKGVQASAEFTPESGKIGVVTRLTTPLASTLSTSLQGGGDSFYPVFRNQHIFSVLHHTALRMTCFSKVDGSTCGTVQPSSPLLTSDHADSWVDQHTGRAYTPTVDQTTRPNGVMLSCLDLDKYLDCGAVKLDTGATVLQAAYVSQPWNVGNEVYFMYRNDATAALMVACTKVPAMTPCAGQPYSAGTGFTIDGGAGASRQMNVYWSPDGTVPHRADGKVSFTSVATGTNVRTLGCFDSTTHAACVGVTPVGWDTSQDPLPRLDATGVLRGFCSRPSRTKALVCYDLKGTTMPVSAALEAWMPTGELSWMTNLGGYGTTTGTKSLMPWSANRSGRTICFDWATNATCAGFPMTTPLADKTYSLRADPVVPTCVWSMGDDGILESVETQNGMSGCNRSTATVAPVYCDGRTDHVKGWETLTLNNLAGAHSGFTLTLLDAKGKAVPGWATKTYGASTTSIDISSIPFAGNTTLLTAQVAFIKLSPSAFVTATPTVEMTWKGDPVQMCSTTTATKVCPTVFTPLVPKGVAHRSEAVTKVGASIDTVGIDLAFDWLTPLSCANAGLAVTTTVNGAPSPKLPGLDVRIGTAIQLSYSVQNTGRTRIKAPAVTDDLGTASAADDITPVYVSGDANSDGFMEPGETWLYTATGASLVGDYVSHATATGTPTDVSGAVISGVVAPLGSDLAYYVISSPGLSLTGGIYGGHDHGASCGRAQPAFYDVKDAPVTYCYVVTNVGTGSVTSIKLSDLGLGVSQRSMSVSSGSLVSLASGASVILWFETTNTVELLSTATTSAKPASGADVTASATTERHVGPHIFPPT